MDEAFFYRLAWAIEAIRMNRRVNGGEFELLEGTAATCLETGPPSNTMTMLVRTGLPSRVAAKLVFEQLRPDFVNRTQMNGWLQSPKVAAMDESLAWPTADTTTIWQRFRRETLASATENWVPQEGNVVLAPGVLRCPNSTRG